MRVGGFFEAVVGGAAGGGGGVGGEGGGRGAGGGGAGRGGSCCEAVLGRAAGGRGAMASRRGRPMMAPAAPRRIVRREMLTGDCRTCLELMTILVLPNGGVCLPRFGGCGQRRSRR